VTAAQMWAVRLMTSVASVHQAITISQEKAVKVRLVLIISNSHVPRPPACGCSSLALSDQCDQVIGSCDCQPGAVGTKCDDCAFGFTGLCVLECESTNLHSQALYQTVRGVTIATSNGML